ncbi:MAG TPA: hypothetical protein VM364_00755 [Vicinamibacterales bacterium]|nr:hypothetical protein [Vicinamibacterales bacterium]
MITRSLFHPLDDVADITRPRLEFVAPGSWIFRIPREVRSLNATMWGHWRNAQREREGWEHELAGAIAAYVVLRGLDGWRPGERVAQQQLVGRREYRRVQVLRLIPSARHRLDPGNRRACDKHLVDAMKRVGLITNDNAKWLEHGEPLEMVAPDGKFWTVIQLDRPDVRAAWRS